MNGQENNFFPASLTLREFTSRIGYTIRSSFNTQNQWITAELSDVGVRGGHCYMELIEKDNNGVTTARIRGTIWASAFPRIKSKFERATGQSFSSGLKVMILGSANFHDQYGLSVNITDIDPTFTLGDMERIRKVIIERLTHEGIIDKNKQVEMPLVPQRIAIISAVGAAGYGDFMNQLMHNKSGFVFYTHLFNAVMQGERTSTSIRQALQEIEMTIDLWDCIVIIRGGGATSDLNGFDDLELARAVALSSLPVIVGIGHERDRTVLDDIAHTRVKTPTAAAEWLIGKTQSALDYASELANFTLRYASEQINGAKQQLSHLEALIPSLAKQQISEKNVFLGKLTTALPVLVEKTLNEHRRQLTATANAAVYAGNNRILRAFSKEDTMRQSIVQAYRNLMSKEAQRLTAFENLTSALSPQNTLKRGYSITRLNGKALKDTNKLRPGDTIATTLSSGTLTSTIIEKTAQ